MDVRSKGEGKSGEKAFKRHKNKKDFFSICIYKGICERKSMKLLKYKDKKIRFDIKSTWKIFMTFVVPSILSVSCFWIIYYASNMYEKNLLGVTINLVLGSLVSGLLKEARYD